MHTCMTHRREDYCTCSTRPHLSKCAYCIYMYIVRGDHMNNNNYDVTLLNFQTADELHVGLEWKLTNLRYILVASTVITSRYNRFPDYSGGCNFWLSKIVWPQIHVQSSTVFYKGWRGEWWMAIKWQSIGGCMTERNCLHNSLKTLDGYVLLHNSFWWCNHQLSFTNHPFNLF